MIHFNKQPGQRILELGGGDNPHELSDVCVDIRPGPRTHFTANFEEPLPIQDNEFDVVYCAYCLEHLAFTKVVPFLKEVFRVLKPGGKAVFVTPNVMAQLEWIRDHPNGWDGKDYFSSASELLFGSQDYPENTHKNLMDPRSAEYVFQAAGFKEVGSQPYNERKTDLCIEASKPPKYTKSEDLTAEELQVIQQGHESMKIHGHLPSEVLPLKDHGIDLPPEQLFDKAYFNGGGKVGGYAREGYWDYPVHQITARKILERKPESVLELGCARGYVLKRIQDSGIRGLGIEVSKHCYMTRVADNVVHHDLLKTPWGNELSVDLCYSVATLEHIPENKLPDVIREMARVSERSLHGVDFGERDDGFDKTHCTLKCKEWWEDQFHANAPGYPVEIVDKEYLEAGPLPEDYVKGDGKLKLNIGCFTTQFHHGWTNIDVLDVRNFSQHYGYHFLQHDCRNGLPFNTGAVDLIYAGHFLEHLTYEEGKKFLKECRRVLKYSTGAMRIIVPDAELLMIRYHNAVCDRTGNHSDFGTLTLDEFDEINDGCQKAPTAAGKLWSLLHEGHASCYDYETLEVLLKECGFEAHRSEFRKITKERISQILRETLDTFPCLSLFCDAYPA